jgi:hypothetical protein
MATEVDDALPTHLPANALVAIQLEGKGVELGTVSAGKVCRYIEAFRLGLQAAIEIVESVRTTQSAWRRKRWVERMADLPLVGIESGCLRILLGAPRQDGLFAAAEQESFTRAMSLMFRSIASVAARQDLPAGESDVELPLAARLRLLGVVARLMPPKRGPIDRIAILGRVASDEGQQVSITLDRCSREYIEAKMEQQLLAEPAAGGPRIVSRSEADLLANSEPEVGRGLPPALFH